MAERDWRATQTRTYKLIASGASPTDKAKLLVYPSDASSDFFGGINQTRFVTSSIGNDTWMFVSGAVKSKGNTTTKGVVTFGGDVFTSGVFYASAGLSGSLQRLLDGSPYLVAGPGITVATQSNGAVAVSASTIYSFSGGPGITVTNNNGAVTLSASFVAGPGITITTQSNGQIAISGSSTGASSGSVIGFGVCDFATTAKTTHTAVGQIIFNPTNYSGSVKLSAALSATGPASASIVLYNIGTSQYVHIGGPGVTTLSTTNTTPTIKESVDLKGATNFDAGQQLYELGLATENLTYPVYVGGAEFRVTGSIAEGGVVYQTTTLFSSVSAFPDSPLPRLEWVTDSIVSVLPSLYENNGLDYWRKPIRLTFQDGVQRVFSSSGPLNVLFVSSGLVGEFGMDTGSSMTARGGDSWYYLYAVPSGSNTSTGSIAVVASDVAPSGVFATNNYGPSGYTNFRYIGPVFYKTSGKGTPGIEVFKQNDSKTFYYNDSYPIYSVTDTFDNLDPTGWINFNVLNNSGDQYALPGTVSKVHSILTIEVTGSHERDVMNHSIRANGALSPFTSPFYVGSVCGPYGIQRIPLELPVGYLREYHSWTMQYKNEPDSTAWPPAATATSALSWIGFEDQYLADYIPATSTTASIGSQLVGPTYQTAVTTPTTQSAVIYTYIMNTNSAVDFETSVVGVMTGSAFNRARYRRNFLAYRSGSSVATIQDDTIYATVPDLESSGSWGFNVRTVGNALLFEVSGSASETVNWKLKLDKNEVP